MGIYARHDNEWYRVDEGGGAGGSAWGDFTTNGDETTSNTWGPDANGRMWKYAEWDVANDYTVNLTGGLYHVLTVGGGHSPGSGQVVLRDQGQPGLVNEGYWEFSANPATSITVGSWGRGSGSDPSHLGQPSSLGDYGTQGGVVWGSYLTGRGAQGNDHEDGYRSSITGSERQYAPGFSGPNRPGRSGKGMDDQPNDGCVIIATAAPNAKALNWVHTTYHAEVNDGTVTAVYTQKHYADGKTTPLPTGELVEASYGVSEGWLFVDGELQPPPTPPEPTRDELIAELQARIVELQQKQ